ncbi:hypothetical protein PENSPDRAFT_755746 [Peniophora sp. CONT]|nr:hypothetical protein PENSPDRAFT_755746 [Peniophora sp. CONT]
MSSSSAHDLRLRRATSPTTEASDHGSERLSGSTGSVPTESPTGLTPYRLTGAFISLAVGIAKIIASILTHSFEVVDVAVMLVAPVLLYLVDQVKSSVKFPGPLWWFFHHKLEFRSGNRRSRDRQHTPSLPSSPVKVVYENAFDQHVASYSAMLHNYIQRDQRTSAPEIVYVEEMSGEPHDPTWSATCTVAHMDTIGQGTGKTKTQARHKAAKRVLIELGVVPAGSP